MKPIIEVRGLSKRYQLGTIGMTSIRQESERLWTRLREGSWTRRRNREAFWALRDVSFDVRPGEAIGIIGRNGAGKSTLLKILSRITKQTAGTVTLRGRVASLLEVGTGFHPDLSGRENVFLNGAILGMNKAEIRRKFDEIVAFAEVEPFIDTPVKRYSSGMYVRLAFAVAAHLEPEIFIVDEVLAVGDAAFQAKCLGKMNAIGSQGRTVIFVSHNQVAVERLCPRAVLLDSGRIVVDGPSDRVIRQYMAAGRASGIELAQRQDRTGSGAVRFASVDLAGADGGAVSAFRCGDTAVFTLRFENHLRADLRRCQIGVGIDDAVGQRILTLNSKATGTAADDIPSSATAMDVRIARLPLVPGRYGFTLYFAVDGVIADWVQQAGSFDVEPGDYYGTGQLPVPGQGQFLVDHHFSFV